MKNILLGFLLSTAGFFAVIAVFGFIKLHKSIECKDDIDDKKAVSFGAIILSWLLCGLFIFLSYLIA